MYNTNLVFDRSGVLVAKHWKENLFMEPIFDVPSQPAFTTFTTDFGVNFGTFICFESLWERAFELVQKVFRTLQETPDVSLLRFQYPNVTDIVFPTAWVDEVPFLTAAQVKDNYEKFILSLFNFTLCPGPVIMGSHQQRKLSCKWNSCSFETRNTFNSCTLMMFIFIFAALGSGIFSPSGPLNYTYSSRGGSKLVTAKVPIRLKVQQFFR